MPYTTEKICFWHWPKTGGTWFINTVEKSGITLEFVKHKHESPRENVSGLFDTDRTHVTILRDKFSWLRSVYWHLKDHIQRWPDDPWERSAISRFYGPLSKTTLKDFPTFLECHSKAYEAFLNEFTISGVEIISFEHIRESTVSSLKKAGEEFDADIILNSPKINDTKFHSQPGHGCRYYEEIEISKAINQVNEQE